MAMSNEVVLKSNASVLLTALVCLIFTAIGGTCVWIVVKLINADLWQPLLWVPVGLALACVFLIFLMVRRATMRVLTITPDGITMHRPFARRFIPAGGLKAGVFTETRTSGGAASAQGTVARTEHVDAIYLGLPDGTVRGLFVGKVNGPRISRVIQGLDHMLGVEVVRLPGDPGKKNRRPDVSSLKISD